MKYMQVCFHVLSHESFYLSGSHAFHKGSVQTIYSSMRFAATAHPVQPMLSSEHSSHYVNLCAALQTGLTAEKLARTQRIPM